MAKLTKRQNPAEMQDDNNPEWTAEDFSKARPASEVLPDIFPKETLINSSSPRRRGSSRLI